MNLECLRNQARQGLLDEVPPSKELGLRLFESARTRLRDAQGTANSNETRFDCAYNAIRAVADIGLLMHGYRTPTNRPGHHATAIQNLRNTFGIDDRTLIVLDGLRKQRHLADYSGDLVTNAALDQCIEMARPLLATAEQHLRAKGWL